MPKARQILERIDAVTSTKKITQAMKMVSVAKLGKLKEKSKQETPYIDSYIELFEELLGHQKGEAEAPPKSVNRALIIGLTTNRGLCGALNQQVLKEMVKTYKAYEEAGVQVTFLPIGKRGVEFFERRTYSFVNGYSQLEDKKDMSEHIHKLSDELSEDFAAGKYDEIKVVYQPSKVAAKDKIAVDILLPLVNVTASSPSKEKEEDIYAYEPGLEEVLSSMKPHVVRMKLYKMWLSAGIAEQSMRMVFTSQATDNAEKLIKKLQIAYNRVRQSVITRSLTEIVAGTDAQD